MIEITGLPGKKLIKENWLLDLPKMKFTFVALPSGKAIIERRLLNPFEYMISY